MSPEEEELEVEYLLQCECWWANGAEPDRVERGENCPVHHHDDV